VAALAACFTGGHERPCNYRYSFLSHVLTIQVESAIIEAYFALDTDRRLAILNQLVKVHTIEQMLHIAAGC
jgi:hypothetical protein